MQQRQNFNAGQERSNTPFLPYIYHFCLLVGILIVHLSGTQLPEVQAFTDMQIAFKETLFALTQIRYEHTLSFIDLLLVINLFMIVINMGPSGQVTSILAKDLYWYGASFGMHLLGCLLMRDNLPPLMLLSTAASFFALITKVRINLRLVQLIFPNNYA
ncbi:MAG: hypothetical protein HWE20_10175 [Gammaproteobacteria bacterium]|nr:hypothetical protein [Gammaproteobacteria bacterium]